MLCGEGAAGMGLQVPLEGNGLVAGAEGDGDLDLSRAELGRVLAAAGVVHAEAGVEVTGQADVVPGGMG